MSYQKVFKARSSYKGMASYNPTRLETILKSCLGTSNCPTQDYSVKHAVADNLVCGASFIRQFMWMQLLPYRLSAVFNDYSPYVPISEIHQDADRAGFEWGCFVGVMGYSFQAVGYMGAITE